MEFDLNLPKKQMPDVFPLAYFPDIAYMAHYLASPSPVVDTFEHYEKQTCRNRTDIMTPSGRQTLSLPVSKKAHHTPVNQVLLSYKQDWRPVHWRTIKTAYGGSPYFYFYADELEEAFRQKPKYLTEFTGKLFKIILNQLGCHEPFTLSGAYVEKWEPGKDYRNYWFPSKDRIMNPKYIQVFEYKFGFMHNLSVIDLLFNMGPEAGVYLHSLAQKLKNYYSG